MDITWLGHSCFRLHDADMVVVTDPYPASVGLRVDGRPASVVTVSNTHPNHDNTASIEGDPKVFRDPGEYEYNGVTARGVMTPLADDQPQTERNVASQVAHGLDQTEGEGGGGGCWRGSKVSRFECCCVR